MFREKNKATISAAKAGPKNELMEREKSYRRSVPNPRHEKRYLSGD
jgi:hypothetical protein